MKTLLEKIETVVIVIACMYALFILIKMVKYIVSINK